MAEEWIRKYGSFALVISYFVPVVRHVMPYVVGMNGMTFMRYAMISFSTGLVWTLLYFMVGRFAGSRVEDIGAYVDSFGTEVALALLAFLCFLIIVKKLVNNRKRDVSASRSTSR